MLIEVHTIQNHSPANLNRDDLGAPKTCFFGGVLRSRISSQCLKRSIRTSDEFRTLLGGVRTRRLAKWIAEKAQNVDLEKKAERVLKQCGFLPKQARGKKDDDDEIDTGDSKMLVYTTHAAIGEMIDLLGNGQGLSDNDLAIRFAELISKRTAVPDMALSGRMLEPDKAAKDIWEARGTTVEAALQVAHAISTHEARPEVDYYVAADDIPGEDAGAGFLDEAMFASACFYKYFSINWETLTENLKGYGENHKKLAAHTVGAFIRGAALANPTGKQNSFAAHNPPDGMLIEIRDSPICYANAFADPVGTDARGIIEQSIAQLGQYVNDLDVGYGRPKNRFWFSPNLRYPLSAQTTDDGRPQAVDLAENNLASLDKLISEIVTAIGHDWEEVRKVVLTSEAVL